MFHQIIWDFSVDLLRGETSFHDVAKKSIANGHKLYQAIYPNAKKGMIREGETRRDIKEGEDKPSSTELNNAKVSAVAEELDSLTLTKKDSDANSDLDEVAILMSDPELWRPHPPNEDCPVCLVPLPLPQADNLSYWPCCGKIICSACEKEHFRARHISNTKRQEKELPKLLPACPFCREPIKALNDPKVISEMQERMLKGDADAASFLAEMYLCGDFLLPQDEIKAMKLYHVAADLGSARANFTLSYSYNDGTRGVMVDLKKAHMFAERAVKLNYPLARLIMAKFCNDEGDTELAIRHLMHGAAAGCKKHMEYLWDFFYQGGLSKTNLEDTLRKFHRACDDMNSEERERYTAWKGAEEENNQNLAHVYDSYYQGEINAKQLKIALKMMREEGNGGG